MNRPSHIHHLQPKSHIVLTQPESEKSAHRLSPYLLPRSQHHTPDKQTSHRFLKFLQHGSNHMPYLLQTMFCAFFQYLQDSCSSSDCHLIHSDCRLNKESETPIPVSSAIRLRMYILLFSDSCYFPPHTSKTSSSTLVLI